MIVLALDTTTRAGSVAVLSGDAVLIERAGDAFRPHGTRLPGDVLAALADAGLRVADVDVWAVAAGPGAFTGLRVGIATIQGLAFATGKPVAAVSALDALADAVADRAAAARCPLIAACMDAARGEVFAALYRGGAAGPTAVAGPMVAAPGEMLDAWQQPLSAGRVLIAGEGAVTYRELLATRLSDSVEIEPQVPTLAGAIARRGAALADAGAAGPPHAVRPLYLRRPDAELAREGREPAGERRP